jgi:hypothetical protein
VPRFQSGPETDIKVVPKHPEGKQTEKTNRSDDEEIDPAEEIDYLQRRHQQRKADPKAARKAKQHFAVDQAQEKGAKANNG